MKKLSWLLSSLSVVGFCPLALAQMTTCGPFPVDEKVPACSTEEVTTMLHEDNLMYGDYWTNPNCLELVIKYVNDQGKNIREKEKDDIEKALENAKDLLRKSTDTKTYDIGSAFFDRSSYIKYKLGIITANSTTRYYEKDGKGGYVFDYEAGCYMQGKGKRYPLATGEDIVKVVGCLEGGNPSLNYCDMPPNDPKRKQQKRTALTYIVDNEICLMKLNAMNLADWATSQEYQDLLKDVTSQEMTSYAEESLATSPYGKCKVMGEHDKIKANLARIASGDIPTSIEGEKGEKGKGGGGHGKGGGGHGKGGGKGGSNPADYNVSHFKLSESDLKELAGL